MPRHLFHVEKFIETKFVYLDIHLVRLFLVLSYTVYFDIPLLSNLQVWLPSYLPLND